MVSERNVVDRVKRRDRFNLVAPENYTNDNFFIGQRDVNGVAFNPESAS